MRRKTSAVMESFSQVQKSSEIPPGESIPEFEERPCPVIAQEGEMSSQLTSLAEYCFSMNDYIIHFYYLHCKVQLLIILSVILQAL